MFVMIVNTSDVFFFFYVLCHFIYCILLLDKNYKQYLEIYIIFIYIRQDVHYLKKPAPQVCLLPQGLKRLLCLRASCTLNNYEYIVYHVSIYKNIKIKVLMKKKNL